MNMKHTKKKVVGFIAVLLVGLFVLGGCGSLERGMKSFKSNVGGGLYREVKVINQSGDIVFEDEGKIDIEVNDYRLKYIDKNGDSIIVYLGNSTAIIKEK